MNHKHNHNQVLAVRIFGDIIDERRRQDQLRDSGRFTHTCADDGQTDFARLATLGEEFGEACGAAAQAAGACTDRTTADLRKELIQVAAVAVAFLENLDRREVAP